MTARPKPRDLGDRGGLGAQFFPLQTAGGPCLWPLPARVWDRGSPWDFIKVGREVLGGPWEPISSIN